MCGEREGGREGEREREREKDYLVWNSVASTTLTSKFIIDTIKFFTNHISGLIMIILSIHVLEFMSPNKRHVTSDSSIMQYVCKYTTS